MSSKEFGEWMAYERIEPSEPYRSDVQTALICFTIVNTLRGLTGAKGRGSELKDFLLEFEPKTLTRRPVEEVEAKLRVWLRAAKAEQDKRKARQSGKRRKHLGNFVNQSP